MHDSMIGYLTNFNVFFGNVYIFLYLNVKVQWTQSLRWVTFVKEKIKKKTSHCYVLKLNYNWFKST